MSWKAIAKSVEGTSHIKNGLPCQDYGKYTVVDDNILIGAVADGAGSARYSDVGSRLAVQTTLNYLEQWILGIVKRGKTNLSKPIPPKNATKIFEKTLKSVRNRFEQEIDVVYEYSFKDLSCTLLAFVATPDWMAAMQIGDGFIVMRSQNTNSNYQLLFSPAKGEYANQTTFVTSASALSELQVKVIPQPPKFIFAATDGLERMAIDFAKQQAYQGFFPPFEKGFEKSIKENRVEEEEQDVYDWLNSEQVNSKTDDDKTILVGIYSNVSGQVNNLPPKNASVEKSLVKDSAPAIEPEITTLNNGATQTAKLSSLNKTTSTLFSQAILFNFLVGIFLHFLYFINKFIVQQFSGIPYYIDGFFVQHLEKLSPIINRLQLHYNVLLSIVAVLVFINSIITFFEFKRYVKVKDLKKAKFSFSKKSKRVGYSLLITILALVIGMGTGWSLYYFIYLFVK